MTTTEALIVSDPVASGAIAVRREPREILAEAHKAAAALKEVLDSKADPVMMNGERYLEVDDWQTVGRFYGITAKIESVAFHIYEIPGRDPIYGFDASAVALGPGEQVLSRAEASCLTDEDKWGARPKYAWVYAKTSRKDERTGEIVADELWPADYEPQSSEIVWVPNPKKPGKSMPLKVRALIGDEAVPLFQLKSMAQTRASSKVMRQVLAFVPVMAGYKPTPAEELEGFGAERVRTKNGTLADAETGEIMDADPPHPADVAAPPQQSRRQPPAAQNLTPPERRAQQSGHGSDLIISEKQAMRYRAIAREAGWTDEELRDWLAVEYGYSSASAIPRKQYDEIVREVQKGPEGAKR
jgi:hypothetical protein